MSQTETLNEVNTDASRSMRAKVSSFLQQQGAFVMLVIVCIARFVRYEAFLTPENLLNVVRQNSMLGLVALGMTFVILTGGIDLSVGALLAVAGVMLASRLGAGQPVAGSGYELDAIAAVVIGGTLLTGGQGSVLSTLVGVLLLGVIFNLFNLEGTISPWWQLVLRGLILLFVVVVQNRLTKLK